MGINNNYKDERFRKLFMIALILIPYIFIVLITSIFGFDNQLNLERRQRMKIGKIQNE